MRRGRAKGTKSDRGGTDNNNPSHQQPQSGSLIPLSSPPPLLISSVLHTGRGQQQSASSLSPQPTSSTGFFSSGRPSFLSSASASSDATSLEQVNHSESTSSTSRIMTNITERIPNSKGFFKTKQPLVALAASPSKEHVAVVGQDAINVLHVMVTDRGTTTKSYPNLMYGTKNLDYQFSDVTWAPKSAGNRIASASLNGAITLWDVEKRCKERIIREQDRQATISFHTTEPLLASACRDGIVRIWDVRDNKTAQFIFDGRCGDAFAARINPVNKDIVAACYENSVVKWDLRNQSKWVAMNSVPHSGIVQTCEWHPDGHRLATAGKDKTVKVWTDEITRTSLRHTIPTLSNVHKIRWRPGSETQIAACFLQNSRILVLDVLQPYVPAMIFDIHKDVATSFLWYDSDTVWSCSRDKTFLWQDIRAAYKPRESLSTVAMGWGLGGDLTMAVESKEIRNVWCNVDDFLKGRKGSRRPPSTTTELAPEEQPAVKQKAAILHTGTFDTATFMNLAKNYKLNPNNIWESCELNAHAAADQDQYKAAQAWKVVQLLYGTTSIAPRSMTAMLMSKLAQRSSSPNPFDLPERFSPQPALLEIDPWLRKMALQPRPSILGAILDSDDSEDDDKFSNKGLPGITTPSDVIGTGFNGINGNGTTTIAGENVTNTFDFGTSVADMDDLIILGWDPSNVLYETLEYYAFQGNVQMCVTLVHVLANKIEVASESVELWTWSYLDLLRRLQMWSVAADVISSTRISAIKEMHKGVSPISTGCGECRKHISTPIEGGLGWRCHSCNRMVGSCSFCHKTVKTLYAWCQGCSHGGHLACLKTWFEQNHECCAGCGHYCIPRTSLSHNIRRKSGASQHSPHRQD